MVVTWVTLLKTVPWTEVIANAPAITEGAKKLWNTVARKSGASSDATEAEGAAQAASGGVPAGSRDEAVALLQSSVAALNTTVTELQGQLLTSTELIRALADQNTELIARVEAHRRRLLWLSGVVAVVAALAVGHVLLTFKA